jgi:hypothetical protein
MREVLMVVGGWWLVATYHTAAINIPSIDLISATSDRSPLGLGV